MPVCAWPQVWPAVGCACWARYGPKPCHRVVARDRRRPLGSRISRGAKKLSHSPAPELTNAYALRCTKWIHPKLRSRKAACKEQSSQKAMSSLWTNGPDRRKDLPSSRPLTARISYTSPVLVLARPVLGGVSCPLHRRRNRPRTIPHAPHLRKPGYGCKSGRGRSGRGR